MSAERKTITVVAPAGPLGVTFREHKPHTGGCCVVEHVGRFSPLFTKLIAGDWVSAVDGQLLRNWKIDDVKKLFLDKSKNRERRLTVLRIKPYQLKTANTALPTESSEMAARMARARAHAFAVGPPKQTPILTQGPIVKHSLVMPPEKPKQKKRGRPPGRKNSKKRKRAQSVPRSPAAKTPKNLPKKQATSASMPKDDLSLDPHRLYVKEALIKSHELKEAADALEAMLPDPRLSGQAMATNRLQGLVTSMRQEMSPYWTAPNAKLTTWERNFKALIRFKQEKGHCRVESSNENKELATWVAKQRHRYTKKDEVQRAPSKIRLDDDIALLNRLDFTWRVADHPPWDAYYEQLQAFVDREGHARVPQIYEPNRKLGNWVHTQRKEYEYLQDGKHSILTEERVKKLEDIDFQWKLRKGRPKKTDARYKRVSRKGNQDDKDHSSAEASGEDANNGTASKEPPAQDQNQRVTRSGKQDDDNGAAGASEEDANGDKASKHPAQEQNKRVTRRGKKDRDTGAGASEEDTVKKQPALEQIKRVTRSGNKDDKGDRGAGASEQGKKSGEASKKQPAQKKKRNPRPVF